MQHALGFAGAARGVEDEQRILGVHRLGRAVAVDQGEGLVVPVVAASLPVDPGVAVGDHQYGADVRAVAQRPVDAGLQRDAFAAAHGRVGGDHQPAVGVEDALAQRVGAKPPNTTECTAPIRAQASMA